PQSGVPGATSEARPQAPARKLLECPPAFPSAPLPVEEAERLLHLAVGGWFDGTAMYARARGEAAEAMDAAKAAALTEAGYESLKDVEVEEERQKLKKDLKHRRAVAGREVKRRHRIRAWKQSPRLSVQAAAGLGKTTLAAKELAHRPELWGRHIDIAAPR